ncbi:MAG: hypothetical protein HXL35_10135 [Prevotellaceae bacterium]|nr:hypothetical protein [Prevotellaceae bacterium]
MKDILKLLPLIYWLSVAICVLMVVVYENELLLPGWLAVDKQYDFLASTIMECLTICCIPVAFRLFKFSIPGRTIKYNAEGYVRWASVRLALFVVPMMVNTWLYYQFMNVAFGYMAIIDMLCLLLVYPTRARYLYETGQEK